MNIRDALSTVAIVAVFFVYAWIQDATLVEAVGIFAAVAAICFVRFKVPWRRWFPSLRPRRDDGDGWSAVVQRAKKKVAAMPPLRANSEQQCARHVISLESEVLWDDNRARLWLERDGDTGELHGFQPQPAKAPRWTNPHLVITRALLAKHPVVFVHYEGERECDALDLYGLDGTFRWSVRFDHRPIRDDGLMFVTHDTVVLVNRQSALALALRDGALLWRTKL